MTMTSTRRRPAPTLHAPMPPEVDPDTPLPSNDPNPSPLPDDVPPSGPRQVPEGDPPVKPLPERVARSRASPGRCYRATQTWDSRHAKSGRVLASKSIPVRLRIPAAVERAGA